MIVIEQDRGYIGHCTRCTLAFTTPPSFSHHDRCDHADAQPRLGHPFPTAGADFDRAGYAIAGMGLQVGMARLSKAHDSEAMHATLATTALLNFCTVRMLFQRVGDKSRYEAKVGKIMPALPGLYPGSAIFTYGDDANLAPDSSTVLPPIQFQFAPPASVAGTLPRHRYVHFSSSQSHAWCCPHPNGSTHPLRNAAAISRAGWYGAAGTSRARWRCTRGSRSAASSRCSRCCTGSWAGAA